MTEECAPAKVQAKSRVAVDAPAPRESIMSMCMVMLAIYMRQLQGDTDDEQRATLCPSDSTSARRGRAPTPPAEFCGARLRDGSPCPRPPAEGRRRCRSHGCAPRTGAPKGNRNALKHGCFTAKEIARGRRISEFIRECRETMRQIEGG